MGKHTENSSQADYNSCTETPQNNNFLEDHDDQSPRNLYVFHNHEQSENNPFIDSREQQTLQNDVEFIQRLTFKNVKQKIEILEKEGLTKQLNLLKALARAQKNQHDLFLNLFVHIIHKLSSDENDFTVLYKDKKAIQILKFITKNKQTLPTSVRKLVKRFLDLIESRILYYPYANVFYPKLIATAQKLKRIYQCKGQTSNKLYNFNQNNRIYIHLVKEAQDRPYREDTYYIRQMIQDIKVPLSQYMVSLPKLLQSPKWKQILSTIHRKIQLQNLNQLKPLFQQFLKFQKRIANTKKLHRKKYCLGCSKFFCVSWNIYQQTLHQGNLAMGGKIIDIISTTNKEKRKGIIKKIANKICGLLNSGGGILLFDCETICLSVIPHGRFLTFVQRQQIARIIKEQVIKKIYPKLELRTDIVLNFVKLMRYPFYKLEQYEQIQLSNKAFVDDLYVMRMIARPKANTLYTFQDEEKLYKPLRHGYIAETFFQSMEVKKESILEIASKLQYHSSFDHNVCQRSQFSLQSFQWSIENIDPERDLFYQNL